MGTSLNASAASERTADLQRAANRRAVGRAGLWRRRTSPAASSPRPAPVVRLSHADEAGTIRRLAELDDAPELGGEVLVATIGPDVVAALSLNDGRVVANPFVLTSGAVELLRDSARTVTAGRHHRRRWRSALRPRLTGTARQAVRD